MKKILSLLFTFLLIVSFTANSQTNGSFKSVRFYNVPDSAAFLATTWANFIARYPDSGGIYYNEQSNKFRVYQNGVWGDLGGAGGGGTGNLIGTLTTPRIPYATGANTLADDSNLSWDNTNKRLNLGNARLFSYGTNNLMFGNTAGNNTMTGVENMFFGTNAGSIATTSNRNTYFGYNAGASNLTGFNNAFFGNSAGRLTTGSANTYIGKSAGENGTSGGSNTAIGANALLTNIVGGSNTAIGVNALNASTANNNTAIGANAGLYITTGTRITAIGFNTFANPGTTAPTDALAIGYNALFSANGVRNIGIGTETLSQATNVNDNVSIGVNSGDFFAPSGGNQNVFIGNQSAQGSGGTNSSGSNSVLIGFQTGHYNQGSSNIMLGSLVNDISAATVTGSNKITIGTDINDQAPTTSNTLTIQNAIYGTGNSATGTTVSTGNIGLYTVAPSARLHLPTGTASPNTAPLKIPSGTLLTTPELGALETDANAIYWTNNAGTRLDLTAGGGSPGGSNTYIQYNNAGVFGGDAGLSYNNGTRIVTVNSGTNSILIAPTAIQANSATQSSSLTPGSLLVATGLEVTSSAGGATGDIYLTANSLADIALRVNGGTEMIKVTGGSVNRLHLEDSNTSGTNGPMGTGTLVGGTLTIANTNVTANTRIFITIQTPGGTQGFISTSRIANTSFTVTSTSATETSTFSYLLIEPM